MAEPTNAPRTVAEKSVIAVSTRGTVQRQAGWLLRRWKVLQPGASISQGDRLRTVGKSSVDLLFPADEAIVRLLGDSEIKCKELGKPTAFERKFLIELRNGRLTGRWRRRRINGLTSFTVEIPEGAVGVFGMNEAAWDVGADGVVHCLEGELLPIYNGHYLGLRDIQLTAGWSSFPGTPTHIQGALPTSEFPSRPKNPPEWPVRGLPAHSAGHPRSGLFAYPHRTP